MPHSDEMYDERIPQEPASFRVEVHQEGAITWPDSLKGVTPVLAAIQKLLTHAAEGNSELFDDGRFDLDYAVDQWQLDLFGAP